MEVDSLVSSPPQDGARRSSERNQALLDISFEASEYFDGSIDLATASSDSRYPPRKIGDPASITSWTTDPEMCCPDTVGEMTTLHRLDMFSTNPPRYETSGKDPDLAIQYAQILAEQMIFDDTAAFSIGDYWTEPSPYGTLKDERMPLKWNSQRNALSQIFPRLKRHRLQDLTDLLGAVPDSVGKRPPQILTQRRQQGSTELGIGYCNSIDAPYVAVQRGDNVVEMTSSALSFWEDLSLGPLSKEKNIKCLSVIPSRTQKNVQLETGSLPGRTAPTTEAKYVHDQVQSFVDQMSNSYQSLKLGTCNVLSGQRTCKVAADTSEFFSYCELLGKYTSVVDVPAGSLWR